MVSIHAPGRGATEIVCDRDMWNKMFQFTHPGGVRPPLMSQRQSTRFPFQFTHPGGVRHVLTLQI